MYRQRSNNATTPLPPAPECRELGQRIIGAADRACEIPLLIAERRATTRRRADGAARLGKDV